MRFNEGDTVRIDIPDKDDPDFEYHLSMGEVVDVIEDDAGQVSGDGRDSVLYRVRLKYGTVQDFRWQDFRPVGE